MFQKNCQNFWYNLDDRKKSSASKSGGRLYSSFIVGAQNMEGGYIQPSKIQTFSPNSSKESLKWSKESSLDDP